MRIDNFLVFSATSKKDPTETQLFKSSEKLGFAEHINFAVGNTTPLAFIYNEMLEVARSENLNGVIFVHDDVWLEQDPFQKLGDLFERFDVVGVAGCSSATIGSPALWHLMGASNLHGAVAHRVREGSHYKYVTSFGPYPRRVVMIDGVFMAFNNNFLKSGVTFDEECPSAFHFYDLILSERARLAGLRIGVGDILITHDSPGLREFTPDWRAGEEYYLRVYGSGI